MAKPGKILKFGATALSSDASLRTTCDIICHELSTCPSTLVIVVAARSGCTDSLIDLLAHLDKPSICQERIEEILSNHLAPIQKAIEKTDSSSLDHYIKELRTLASLLKDEVEAIRLNDSLSSGSLNSAHKDSVIGYGELFSAVMLAGVLAGKNKALDVLDSRKVIVTNDSFGDAIVDIDETSSRVAEYFSHTTKSVIASGFVGATADGQHTTLGRGSSDLSATLFGSILGVDEIQIWASVDGILTADPSKVGRARTIEQLSYEEAMELSHFGAKVIHPRAIQPASNAGIPLLIKNIAQAKKAGTKISAEPFSNGRAVTGTSSISPVSLIRVEGGAMAGAVGLAKRLFTALSEQHVNIILISQASSEHSICFAVAPEDAPRAVAALNDAFSKELSSGSLAPITAEDKQAVVAVVGACMRNTPGVAGRTFQALGKNGINVNAIAQGSSELNISVVIDQADETKALEALHDAFFVSDKHRVHLCLLGVGQVGATLLEQLSEHAGEFAKRHLEIKVVALANSTRSILNAEGVPLENWQAKLSSATPMNLESFVDSFIGLNLPNSIFIDCTANEGVAACYKKILEASISVVTPNKRANSAPYSEYLALKELAKQRNVKFFYETNVGAGLPIISTLNDLIASGDEILKIEAVLSGTLSYLFNTFTPEARFSEIVRVAQEQGFTEPDPRDDLSGMDVARKLLILAREIGLNLELNDISVESLIPASCEPEDSVEEFYAKLQLDDERFSSLITEASAKKCGLRYIGIIEDGKASVALTSVDNTHAFYNLSGTDNIISFTTRRYQERPLVVKGPGAGTAVTAAGVLADTLRVVSYLL